MKTHFTQTHYTWHKTYTKEKERYMTCRGETANQNQRNVSIELGGRISRKYSMGKGTRDCNKVVKAHNISPGPSDQTKISKFISKNNTDNIQFGKFPTSRR